MSVAANITEMRYCAQTDVGEIRHGLTCSELFSTQRLHNYKCKLLIKYREFLYS